MIKTSNLKSEAQGLEKLFQRQKLISKNLWFSFDFNFYLLFGNLPKTVISQVKQIITSTVGVADHDGGLV